MGSETSIVSRACSTLNGHSEVKRAVFRLWLTRMSQATPFAAYFLLRMEPHTLLEYTMVVNHVLFKEDGVFRFHANGRQV